MTASIEVTIGQPLAKTAPKNKYRFNLEVMFGDADGEDINSIDADAPSEFIPLIQMLDVYNSIEWNDQCDINDCDAWAKLLGFTTTPNWQTKDPAGIAFNRLMDLIPGDPCCDGQYQGSPDNWWISYFDENGNEHECTYTIDGKTLKQRRQ